ncbi:MAG: hypothetical protein J0H43_13600, partial [Actinobacteria bacterium]|nr:hypothetical protein [Actinomycetota bacterium]
PPVKSSPTFGSRTDNPDGSASLTMGRSLPTGWETKVGADVSLSAPASPVPSDNLVRGVTPEPSSGAIWGSLTMPGLSPLGFDKTAVDARYDSGNDEGHARWKDIWAAGQGLQTIHAVESADIVVDRLELEYRKAMARRASRNHDD